MSAPLRHVDLRGRRLPETLDAIHRRDALLIEAGRFYAGVSGREAARLIRVALLRYRGGRWRRERTELTCPAQHAGKLTALLWRLLRTRDAVPSEGLIRAVLAPKSGRSPPPA
jgi:hypothetical protein